MIITDIVMSFIIAVLSGMGVGSAGLFIIYLMTAKSSTQIAAQTLNLIFYIMSCGTSLLFHIRQRTILKQKIFFMILCSFPGIFLGYFVTSIVDETLIKRLFGGLLIFAGITSLINVLKHAKKQKKHNRPRNM